jgi:hypothetical protein
MIRQLLGGSRVDLEEIRVGGGIRRITEARDRIILRMTSGRGYADTPSLLSCSTEAERVSVQAILQALDLLVSCLTSDMASGVAEPREITVQ